ncbi:MAG TPA: SUMF1/EgtB/PvdO family nonheme iron enzyme [Clostridiales bacterium]|nr:SUMF1/EgtB/PvdO family nonheme iron enzyme [Clostridiales bacterium]HQP69347.1 SUMF1/EgtB/PvdO family nonheme iron enzyme [Clostridiales bacterium]
MKLLGNIIALLIVVVILAGCVSTAYKTATIANTIASYDQFLRNHPGSQFESDARSRLDSLYFQSTEWEGSIQAYENFLQVHKNSPYIAEARSRLDSLYFQSTEREGSIYAYENFLQVHKNSPYIAETRSRLDSLYFQNTEKYWAAAQETDNIEGYVAFLDEHPGSSRTKEATARKELLEKHLDEWKDVMRNPTRQSLMLYCDRNSDSPYLTKARVVIQDMEGRDIVDLLNEKKVEIETNGSGIQEIRARIRKLVDYPIRVLFPIGSYFVSSRLSAQNMVSTAETSMHLTGSEWKSVSISAACANRLKHIPGSEDTFTVQRLYLEELARIMPVLDKAGVSYETRQAAVWIVTDNADYNDLGILVQDDRSREINELEAARAMKICVEAGIDIRLKRIWSDWQEIITGLHDAELKTWFAIYGAHFLDSDKKSAKDRNNKKVQKNIEAIPEMVFVEGGTFQMGSTSGDQDEKPVHNVTLSDFYIGKTEVTQAQYQAVIGENPCCFKDDNLPIVNVSWYDAVNFCNRLSEMEGLDICYSENDFKITCNFKAKGYRLPTEAEWEYAARGGNNSKGYKYSGSNNADDVASEYGSNPYSVAAKQPNEIGIYDMSGNVWEWCFDWYRSYMNSPSNNPTGPSSGYNIICSGIWDHFVGFCRVLRGGDWKYRCVDRYYYPPWRRINRVGFRVARTP